MRVPDILSAITLNLVLALFSMVMAIIALGLLAFVLAKDNYLQKESPSTMKNDKIKRHESVVVDFKNPSTVPDHFLQLNTLMFQKKPKNNQVTQVSGAVPLSGMDLMSSSKEDQTKDNKHPVFPTEAEDVDSNKINSMLRAQRSIPEESSTLHSPSSFVTDSGISDEDYTSDTPSYVDERPRKSKTFRILMTTDVQCCSSDDVSEKIASPVSFSSNGSRSRSLINRKLRAAWPQRWRTSSHTGQDHDEKRKKRKRSSHQQQIFDPTSLFVGSKTREEVSELLKPQSFVLFYPVPEDEDSLAVSLRLHLAYKKTDGKTYFYPVIRRKIGWAVDFDKDHEQPTFENLIKLIEYYLIYSYVDVASQRMEAFPFPEVAEPSKSDDTVFELSVRDL
ncbi:hypothetical protein GCK32_010376 [Trichostrongylus colubriformis]|uniref:SH2 domain-containing protein n=1 Tax=Trichostrongylus colubriformis TaxID=6319 RepID=A0AAN8FJ01_TRICO